MRYGIVNKCEKIAGLFGSSSEQVIPVEFDSPTYKFTHSKSSSLGTKLYSIFSEASGLAGLYSSSSYAQSGLVANYDARDNAGLNTHDSSATTWKNLASSNYDLTLMSGVSWGDDCAICSGSEFFAYCSDFVSGGYGIVNGLAIECSYIVDEEAVQTNPQAALSIFRYYNDYSCRCVVHSIEDGHDVIITSCNEDRKGFKSASAVSMAGKRVTCYTYVPDVKNFSDSVCRIGNSQFEGTGVWYPAAGNVLGLVVGGCGHASGSRVWPFHGKINTIRIYNRALTDAEIADNAAIDAVRY